MRRVRCGEGAWIFHEAPSQHFDVFTNPEVLQTPLFRMFLMVVSRRHDKLNNWPLVIKLNLLLLFLEDGAWAESSNPLILWLVPLITSLHPPESPH